MDKASILEAIKRIAADNHGKAPGRQAFERQTGVRTSDWYPHVWLRWSEALDEAGFAANQFQGPIADGVLIQKYIELIRELHHLPVDGEVRRKARTDKAFPGRTTLTKFGGKEKLLDAVLRYCKDRPGHDDVIALCESHKATSKSSTDLDRGAKPRTGFVYLMKSGRHYKIGHTNSVGSRERQLAIKIPVPPTTVHSIETDDPVGVEAYWHSRFAEKRGEGEWFDLSPEDVGAFRRWKRIV